MKISTVINDNHSTTAASSITERHVKTYVVLFSKSGDADAATTVVLQMLLHKRVQTAAVNRFQVTILLCMLDAPREKSKLIL